MSFLSSAENGLFLCGGLFELPIPIQSLSTLDKANLNASRCHKWNGWNLPINKPFMLAIHGYSLKNYHKEWVV